MNKPKNFSYKRIVCPGCMSVPTILMCSLPDFEYGSSDLIYNYYQCKNCKNIMLEYEPTEDQLRTFYPENYYSFHLRQNYINYYNSKEGKIFYNDLLLLLGAWGKELIEQVKKPISDISVLDYGSGDDYFLYLLEKVGFSPNKLFFYDQFSLIKDSKRFFNGKVNDNLICKFDVIIASHVIEHMNHPYVLFSFAKKFLSQNGRLIIETPNLGGLQYQLTKKSIWGGYHAPRHLVLMRPETIDKLSQCFEFKLIDKSFQDDSWIWLQTLNNISQKNPFASIFLRPLQKGFATGKKERPTALRRRLIKFLSIISKISKKIYGETSIVRMVFSK